MLFKRSGYALKGKRVVTPVLRGLLSTASTLHSYRMISETTFIIFRIKR